MKAWNRKQWKGSVVLLWMSLIFFFSSLPGSGSVSEPPLWYIIERKGAHVVEFGLLTVLMILYLREWFTRENLRWVIATAIMFSLAYGALDELHQAFVFGRGSRLTDVLVDGGGALIGGLIFWLWSQHRNPLHVKNVKR